MHDISGHRITFVILNTITLYFAVLGKSGAVRTVSSGYSDDNGFSLLIFLTARAVQISLELVARRKVK